MKLTTLDFPPELRERVKADMEKFHSWNSESEIISAIQFDSTPCKDKSEVWHCYEVIVMTGNTYFIYSQSIGCDILDHEVRVNCLTIGTVNNILAGSPQWAGLPRAEVE